MCTWFSCVLFCCGNIVTSVGLIHLHHTIVEVYTSTIVWCRCMICSEVIPGPFHDVYRNSNSMEISFCSHPSCIGVIATQFCTWHESCAIVACVKFCSDMIPYTGFTTQNKICAEYRDMLPRTRMDLSSISGLRPTFTNHYSIHFPISKFLCGWGGVSAIVGWACCFPSFYCDLEELPWNQQNWQIRWIKSITMSRLSNQESSEGSLFLLHLTPVSSLMPTASKCHKSQQSVWCIQL